MTTHQASRPVIALLTDFGLADPYLGQMKAVLATLIPEAALLDLCHEIPPHDLLRGAFFLDASLDWLPQGALAVAVIDPGVGSDRRVVLLEAAGRRVLAPDNGLLTLVAARPQPMRAFDVTPEFRPAVNTFHGRDVFAPLAARLARGEPPQRFGPQMRPGALTILAGMEPERDGALLTCRALHVDRFGNVILNLRIDAWLPALARASTLALVRPKNLPLVLVDSYAQLPPGALGVLAGSQGHLELALDRDSAADLLGLAPGDPAALFVAEA